MKILCIIPARAGSKGIPGKNIIEIGGRPLIDYSIQPALTLLSEQKIDEVIVSTDSEEIAEVAKSLGAAVPFLRPAEISADNSKSIDFILHALDFYKEKNIFFDTVLLLQPTSPLRTDQDIQAAVEMYRKSGNDSLISVYREDYINDLVMYKMDMDQINSIPLNPLHNMGIRRQEHGAIYVRNGSIYISSIELIQKGLIIGDKPALYEMDKSKSINLDTPEDLEILRKMI